MLRKLAETGKNVDFFSNDYLGFSKMPELAESTKALLHDLKENDNGATGSRLLSGNHALYGLLENELTTFHNCEAALVFNSGYDANLGFFSSVPQRGDIVLFDEFVHASIRDGIRMGNAKSYKFIHNDIDSLIEVLKRARKSAFHETEVYVVTESVFSMDGDSPDISALVKCCEANNCRLVVDEAHAVGVFGDAGEGLVQQSRSQAKVFARIITFGKALGSHGAAVLGSKELIDYLVNFARSFIYTTGLPPHTVATVLAAYRLLCGDLGAGFRKRLQERIAFFGKERDRLGLQGIFVTSTSAIQSAIIPGTIAVKQVAGAMGDAGIDVMPILAPTVPQGWERLRFCLHAYNSETEIAKALLLLSEFKNAV